ncbi:probable nucleolar protein 5-2 [Phragmites australis]|uniref:probable nucleolar protein 5-2 n=1 Tax=Phragmites australis TaxID=29695 RepID=UPI002D77CA6F|nr:probable nucleolar protein 5-2 [Phragmites australis]
MGRRRSHAPRPAAAAASIAGIGDPPVGRPRSLPKSPTPAGKRSTSTSTSKKRRRKRASPPAGSIAGIAPNLGNYGVILVLFETPSGFAIFCMNEYCLNQPDALENIWAIFGEDFRAREIVWLKEFQTFKDKSSAINHGTGVNRELPEMIMRCHRPCQKLAVGKPEYKRIIETSLGVPCLFDETVMEVMWGLKNLMHSLVPQEELKLTKEDRLPMSQGLKMFLDRYGFDVKPEMVNEDIVVTACVLLDSEYNEKKNSTPLRRAGDHLKDVSGINSEGWDLMKLATALKIICYPVETTIADKEMFTGDELLTLEMDAHKYEDKIVKGICLNVYKEIVQMREVRTVAQKILGSLVKEAKEACKAEQSV